MKFFKTNEFNIKDKVRQFYVYQKEIRNLKNLILNT